MGGKGGLDPPGGDVIVEGCRYGFGGSYNDHCRRLYLRTNSLATDLAGID